MNWWIIVSQIRHYKFFAKPEYNLSTACISSVHQYSHLANGQALRTLFCLARLCFMTWSIRKLGLKVLSDLLPCGYPHAFMLLNILHEIPQRFRPARLPNYPTMHGYVHHATPLSVQHVKSRPQVLLIHVAAHKARRHMKLAIFLVLRIFKPGEGRTHHCSHSCRARSASLSSCRQVDPSPVADRPSMVHHHYKLPSSTASRSRLL